MEITYKNKRIERICRDPVIARKKYGNEMAVKISNCVSQIRVAKNVEYLIELHLGRCHPLTNDRKGQYAMDLVHPYRLVFLIKDGEIQIANILEIVDYH